MKTRFILVVLLAAMIGIGLSGCGCLYQATKGEAAPPRPEPVKLAPDLAKKEVVPVPAARAAEGAGTAMVAGLQDIHFDFDKYNIRQGDAAVLKKDSEWLKANPGKVRIEGHCDERGTVEYNLALGQRRADSTKNYLMTLGIEKSRLETISYGKERPLDPGHNEGAWAKNRRAHLEPMK
jgi:peptidoglycan-associated lipoprotein